MRLILVLCLQVLLAPAAAHAQEREVSIEDFSFLSGNWSGSGLGGRSDEMWMPPSDGRMFGVFKQTGDNGLIFTEFLEITTVNGEFILRLKHFNPDFTGWEQKEDYLTFKLTELDKNRAEFGSLRYQLVKPNLLVIELDMKQADESVTTAVFNLNKTEW